jgi:hypothetical protein
MDERPRRQPFWQALTGPSALPMPRRRMHDLTTTQIRTALA